MIQKWSKQDLIKDLEHVKNGDLFVDDRGIVSNHELTEPINLIGMMNSKKGTIRLIIIILNKNRNVYLQKVKL